MMSLTSELTTVPEGGADDDADRQGEGVRLQQKRAEFREHGDASVWDSGDGPGRRSTRRPIDQWLTTLSMVLASSIQPWTAACAGMLRTVFARDVELLERLGKALRVALRELGA